MYSKELIKKFVETRGKFNGTCTSEHCYATNGVFYSYETKIAYFKDNVLRIDYKTITHTTRVHQNALKNWASLLNVGCVTR